jgi:hypothetical protein
MSSKALDDFFMVASRAVKKEDILQSKCPARFDRQSDGLVRVYDLSSAEELYSVLVRSIRSDKYIYSVSPIEVSRLLGGVEVWHMWRVIEWCVREAGAKN